MAGSPILDESSKVVRPVDLSQCAMCVCYLFVTTGSVQYQPGALPAVKVLLGNGSKQKRAESVMTPAFG